MAVVVPAENQGAWEQKRRLVSLRIEGVGLRLMAAHGLQNVTVEQIAAKDNISTRTFFRYFKNARDVLTAVPARTSRQMCDELLARPGGESLLDGFRAWFHEMPMRQISSPVAALEEKNVQLWGVIARNEPDLIQVESRTTIIVQANLEEVVRVRMGFGPEDDEKVGVLSATLAAMMWYVYSRWIFDADLSTLVTRLDEALDLLDMLRTGASV
jgi:AcrR family transcriptional regulator